MTAAAGQATWVRRFGPAWNPNMADIPEVPAPVGEACGWCEEDIEAGQFGLLIPLAEVIEPRVGLGQVRLVPYHYECNLRGVIGPVNHLKGLCPHGGNGTQPCEEPGLTRRQGAIAAAYYWEGRKAAEGAV